MTTRDETKEKALGVCEDCGELFTVWIRDDGSVYPISPNNVCGCEAPTPRQIDEAELIDEERSDP
ncbi:hypothetical protein [Halopiger goleimassiliensis]|uniref:hypothetical protein n=1 Tax=Halopiger goleimassiliensis TaxID=1293048 RepID=UPI000678117C|nr:hypothetical protein [Halopiger goleimassiliensis]